MLCRVNKRKCDLKAPCGNCIKAHREADCTARKIPTWNDKDNISPMTASSTSSPNLNRLKTKIHPIRPRPMKSPSPALSPARFGEGGRGQQPVGNILAEAATPQSIDSPQTSSDTTATETGNTLLLSTNDKEINSDLWAGDSSLVLGGRMLDQLLLTTMSMYSVDQLLQDVPIARKQDVILPTVDARVMLLLRGLPSRAQCDILCQNYIYVYGKMFCAVLPSWFEEISDKMWQSPMIEVDVNTLALTYAMMAASGSEVHPQIIASVGLDLEVARDSCHDWARNSRKALEIARTSGTASMTSIAAFKVLESYFHSDKNHVSLNYELCQALDLARKLKLFYDDPEETNMKIRETKRRLWMGLVSSDIFQALSLNRPFYTTDAEVAASHITNCNVDDISHDKIIVRPRDECTDVAPFLFTTQFLILCRPLKTSKGRTTTNVETVISVDRSIVEYVDQLPWYLKIGEDGTLPIVPERFTHHYYVFHIMWSCIHTQRLRMHRNFLFPRNEYCYQACLSSVTNVLKVYQASRIAGEKFLPTPHLMAIHYNVFSAAIAQMFFVLVEYPRNHEEIVDNVRFAYNDLKKLKEKFSLRGKLINAAVPIIERLLELYDQGKDQVRPDSIEDLQNYKSDLAANVAYIFGGTHVTEKYLDRLSIKYLVDDVKSVTTPTDISNVGPFTAKDWNWISDSNLLDGWNLEDFSV